MRLHRRTRTVLPILPLLLWPVLFAGNCDSSDTSNPLEDDEFSAVVDLENLHTALPTHLFAPGEDFPCCQVAPTGIRNVSMTLKPGSSFTFRAGRNGIILDTVSCTVAFGATASDRFNLAWDEADLECLNALDG